MNILDNISNLIEETKIPLRGRIAVKPKIVGLRHLRERIRLENKSRRKKKY
jgi:hypothetical protein